MDGNPGQISHHAGQTAALGQDKQQLLVRTQNSDAKEQTLQAVFACFACFPGCIHAPESQRQTGSTGSLLKAAL